MMTKAIFTGIIICGLYSLNGHALTIGEMNVYSRLGDPLDSRIMLDNINKVEMSKLKVSLASRELYIRENIPYPENPDDLKISVAIFDNSKAIIEVRSLSAIREPFVQFLLDITWGNGNIVREYALIIDPPKDLSDQVLTQSDSSSQRLKPASSNQASPKLLRVVKEGDTLGTIAEQYLPAGIAYQQAWMAIYQLNPNAFEDNNLNNLLKGATLRIPDREQMLAVPEAEAAREVEQRIKPQANGANKPLKRTPKLVIGGSASPSIIENKPSKTDILPTEQDDDLLQNFNQMATILVDLAEFEKSIKQEMSVYREANKRIKDELLFVQGDNREITGRMRRIEEQLENIDQFLALQASYESQNSLQLQQAKSNLRPAWPLNDAPSGSKLINKSSSIDTDTVPQNVENFAVSGAQLEVQPTAPQLSQTQQGGNLDSLQSGVPNSVEWLTQKQAQKEMTDGEEATNQKSLTIRQVSDQKIVRLQQEDDEEINAAQSVIASTETLSIADNEPDQSDQENNSAMLVLKDKTSTLLSSMYKYSNNLGSEVWKVIAGIGGGLFGLLILLRLGSRRQLGSDVDNVTYKVKTDRQQYDSSLFDISDESFMASEAIDDESPLSGSEDEINDIEPMAETEIYFAFDKQKQAIGVLEGSLQNNSFKPAVINKLLSLYQQNNEVEKFSKLFDTYANQLQSDDKQQWIKTKLLASKIVPDHPTLASNRESDDNIPFLTDKVIAPPHTQAQHSKEDTDLNLVNDFDGHGGKQTSNRVVRLNRPDSVEDIDEFQSPLEEVNQHDPETALGLAKAYIELGEDEIAIDFLTDAISAGDSLIKQQSEELLKSLDS